MIKPIKISPINTTNQVYFECSNCGYKNIIYWKNKTINTDSDVDMENLLFESCPQCSTILGDRKQLIEILDKYVETGIYLIEHLLEQTRMNSTLLQECKEVFVKYKESNNLDNLRKLKNILYRPVREESETDFTSITPIVLNNNKVSLNDIFENIENILFQI